MGRMARGWALTKQSWAVVRGDRTLLVFPVVAAVAGLLAALLLFGAGAGVVAATGSGWAGAPLFALGVYALTVISVFCSVALAACAARALEGHDTTFAEGIAAARSRSRLIFAWAAVQLVVGLAISALQALLREGAGQLIGSIVGGLANFAWAAATFFVIPTIALEGLGPKEALQKSIAVIRARWGEGVTGAAAVGGIVFVAGFLPAIVLVFLGFSITGSAAPAGAALIVLGIAIGVVAGLVQTTLMAVFKVALYRFATTDQVLGGFDRTALEQAFVTKSRRGA